MKSAMATLSMLLPLLAFGGERGEEIWTVSRSVDDFDGVSRVTAMSPLSYGDPYGWSRVSARCTDGWQHELYFSFDYLNRREDGAPIQVKLGDRKPEQCGVSESTSDKALFLIRDTEQYDACAEMVRENVHCNKGICNGWRAALHPANETTPTKEHIERMSQRQREEFRRKTLTSILNVLNGVDARITLIGMMELDSFAIRFDYYNEGAVTIKYHLAGAREAIQEVLLACGERVQ